MGRGCCYERGVGGSGTDVGQCVTQHRRRTTTAVGRKRAATHRYRRTPIPRRLRARRDLPELFSTSSSTTTRARARRPTTTQPASAATLVPVADAFVDGSTPAVNYGTNVQADRRRRRFVRVSSRFDLSALVESGAERVAAARFDATSGESERRVGRRCGRRHAWTETDHLQQPADELGVRPRRRSVRWPATLGQGAGDERYRPGSV